MAANTVLPHLPDLAMNQIILRLPIKPAIRMSSLSKQWVGLWSALRVLDLDEGYERNDDGEDDFNYKHTNFINILVKYLGFRKKGKQQPLLDKLRLRMRYLVGDEEDAIIHMLLSNSFERNVKELDISFCNEQQEVEDYYCLSRAALFNAKCVTNLNLEYLRIKDIDCAAAEPILPYLKTLSLKNVHFHDEVLFDLISGCPSVEYISLASCSFDSLNFHVSSHSLKSVVVKNCNARHVKVDYSMSLESFTLISKSSLPSELILAKCLNLSYIKIHAQHLKYCGLIDCHYNLKATINTPNMVDFAFTGSIKSKISLMSPGLLAAEILLDIEEFPSFNGPWKHFAALRDFLQAFDCFKNVSLYTRDYKAVIFPKKFKRAFYPPLPNVQNLWLRMVIHPTDETESHDMEKSVCWMAPSLKTFLAMDASLLM